ncbi:hypothetical protein J19TS2_35920 [Cohnella xylanilytica]|uniref:hypothetical protein n=1 Tax=Cohnella xylanilytica TaxID=557555 RepID=UPI001B094021|nr:hypothetical protein [Cohnella xylanilytica]GIO14037.1 hypothetical protein J19TS2_35920 [Cohnella xylanilytica]
MAEYRFIARDGSIAWGTALEAGSRNAEPPAPAALHRSSDDGSWDWELQDGIYLAKDIVRELGLLLEAIRVQLGEAANPEALHANIEASLAVSGRETTLPLGSLVLQDKARTELAEQARRIGAALSGWAREYDTGRALERHGEELLRHLAFRSRCDHHLWTHEVTGMLTGPSGGPTVMQLFNEYLHQIVLLRDALLPFDNWEEVPIELKGGQTRGLRYTERAHAEFLSGLLAKPPAHRDIVRYAQSVLTPGWSAEGYGFQYRLGTILPAGLAAAPMDGPRYLLRWYPVSTVAAENGASADPVAFDYAYADYYSAPRSLVDEGASSSDPSEPGLELPGAAEARLVPVEAGPARFQLDYRLRIGADEYAVDLGQILRGHRFMYRPNPGTQDGSGNAGAEPAPARAHDPRKVLRLPGLATGEKDIHLIRAGGNALVQWALLGKLYPENVVLLDRDDPDEREAAARAGKGFGAKFWVH